jgi:oligo-1,6-glucosidase
LYICPLVSDTINYKKIKMKIFSRILLLALPILLAQCKSETKKPTEMSKTNTKDSLVNGITKKWWKEATVYQVYPRSFKDSNGDGIGDLKGVTEKLDYIKGLGVDVIWLSPHFKSPNADNGYDISDYKDVMTEFGTMKEFDELLAGVQSKGMKLIVDLVVNHCSDEHQWFLESKKSKDNPFRDYFIWRTGKNGGPPNNYGSAFSGSAWTLDKKTNEYYLHTFAVKQPDLNWDNKKVREEVYSAMKFWLDKGVSGFRMDVIPFISKDPTFPDVPAGKSYFDYITKGPHTHDYLQEMNREVMSKYDVMSVGEAACVSFDRVPEFVDERRKELDMIFQFDVVDIDRGNALGGFKQIKPWTLPDLKKIYTKYETSLDKHAWTTVFFSNHDNPRMVSRYGDDSPEYRVPSAKMLATLLMTLKGTPFVYQGDELGMVNYQFKDMKDVNDIEAKNAYQEWVVEKKATDEKTYIKELNRTGRDNVRTPMQWSDEPMAGFTTGSKTWNVLNPSFKTINAKQALSDKNSIYYFYKDVIALRKKYTALVYGDYKDLDPSHLDIFAFTRSMDGQKLLTLVNFGKKEFDYTIPEGLEIKEVLLKNNGEMSIKTVGGRTTIHFKAFQSFVCELK